MALAIVLGLAAIRRRDIARHRAWMIRGYAIGLGAGTQALTHAALDRCWSAPPASSPRRCSWAPAG